MQQVVPLSQLEPGQAGVVGDMPVVGGIELRLMELGVLPGTTVRMVRRAPLGDPLEVEVRGFHLSLRASEAARIGIFLR